MRQVSLFARQSSLCIYNDTETRKRPAIDENYDQASIEVYSRKEVITAQVLHEFAFHCYFPSLFKLPLAVFCLLLCPVQIINSQFKNTDLKL